MEPRVFFPKVYFSVKDGWTVSVPMLVALLCALLLFVCVVTEFNSLTAF